MYVNQYLDIKISGGGTTQHLIEALQTILDDLKVGNHINSLDAKGECEWEDPTLMTEISIEVEILAVDKDDSDITKGCKFEVPAPNDTDVHNNEFVGTVIGKRNGDIQVEDSEQNVYEIEPYRLVVVEDEEFTHTSKQFDTPEQD